MNGRADGIVDIVVSKQRHTVYASVSMYACAFHIRYPSLSLCASSTEKPHNAPSYSHVESVCVCIGLASICMGNVVAVPDRPCVASN